MDALKKVAAQKAADALQSDQLIGLGSGSTVAHFLAALGLKLREGELSHMRGVATSLETQERAEVQGIPLVALDSQSAIALTVDGADEVWTTPEGHIHLVKGRGHSLVREKMVWKASSRCVCIVDSSKLVSGGIGSSQGAFPVEVLQFAPNYTGKFIQSEVLDQLGLKLEFQVRLLSDGSRRVTDNGNLILDFFFQGPEFLDTDQKIQVFVDILQTNGVGIVDHGLFSGFVTENDLIIAR